MPNSGSGRNRSTFRATEPLTWDARFIPSRCAVSQPINCGSGNSLLNVIPLLLLSLLQRSTSTAADIRDGSFRL